MATEQWLPVPGYEGFYKVSDRGNVRAVKRLVKCSTGDRLYPGGPMKLYPLKKGHLQTILRKAGTKRRFYVHQLVLLAFDGPCPPDKESRHLNGDQIDNRYPENLEYATHAVNMADKKKHRLEREARS